MQQVLNIDLSQVTDMFLMSEGSAALHDIDTPSFMRKEYGASLIPPTSNASSGKIVEADEKIINFLSVIKGNDHLPHAS